MQEKKDGTRPVRIKNDVLDEIESLAIKESARRGHLLSITELVDELLRKALTDQGAKSDTSDE